MSESAKHPQRGPGIGRLQIQETIMKFFKKLLRKEEGATAIEYGLIAALIAVAAITAMQGLGSQLQTTFNSTSSAMAQ
jgi:pilus assembly protein Flp/PilA